MSWPIIKLGELIEVQNGYAFKSSDYSDNGYFLMRITNVQKGYISNNNPKYVPIAKKSKLTQFILDEGDILMSLTGNVGRVGVINKNHLPAVLNQRVARLKIKSKEIDKNYLFWFLNNDKTRLKIESAGYGVAQINVSSKQIELIEIPLPPLLEQQRIATILEKVEFVRHSRELATEKLDELAQSIFEQMFVEPAADDGKVINLGECLKFINGRAYLQHELLDSGTPIIRIQNLNGGDRWYYSNLDLPEDKYCDKDDLLFAWSATFGPYIWTGQKSIYHYHIWKVVPFDNINKSFAFYLLKNITEKIKQASHGASMLHMTKSGMEAWKITLPPLSKQNIFANIILKLDELKFKNSDSIEKITQSSASFQSQVFLG